MITTFVRLNALQPWVLHSRLVGQPMLGETGAVQADTFEPIR